MTFRYSLSIQIPEYTSFSLATNSAKLRDFLFGRYDGFLSKDPNDIVTIQLIQHRSSEYDIRIKPWGYELRIPTPWDLALIEGHMKMILGREMLLRGDGVIIHSTCLVRDGKAHLFAAASGTGKSTLMLHSCQYQPLNDDNSLIFIKHGRVYVAGSPFNEKTAIKKQFVYKPYEAIYFIYQSSVDIIEPITPDSGVKKLLKNFLAFRTDDRVSNQKIIHHALDIFDKMTAERRCYVLGVTNSPDFWTTIYEYEKKLSS